MMGRRVNQSHQSQLADLSQSAELGRVDERPHTLGQRHVQLGGNPHQAAGSVQGRDFGNVSQRRHGFSDDYSLGQGAQPAIAARSGIDLAAAAGPNRFQHRVGNGLEIAERFERLQCLPQSLADADRVRSSGPDRRRLGQGAGPAPNRSARTIDKCSMSLMVPKSAGPTTKGLSRPAITLRTSSLKITTGLSSIYAIVASATRPFVGHPAVHIEDQRSAADDDLIGIESKDRSVQPAADERGVEPAVDQHGANPGELHPVGMGNKRFESMRARTAAICSISDRSAALNSGPAQ